MSKVEQASPLERYLVNILFIEGFRCQNEEYWEGFQNINNLIEKLIRYLGDKKDG